MPVESSVAGAIKKDYDAGMGYKELAKKYRMSFRDLSKVLKEEGSVVVTKRELEEVRSQIKNLEERLDKASYLIRHALGNNKITFKCPLCKEWSYLKLLDIEDSKMWACEKCRRVPF